KADDLPSLPLVLRGDPGVHISDKTPSCRQRDQPSQVIDAQVRACEVHTPTLDELRNGLIEWRGLSDRSGLVVYECRCHTLILHSANGFGNFRLNYLALS